VSLLLIKVGVHTSVTNFKVLHVVLPIIKVLHTSVTNFKVLHISANKFESVTYKCYQF
jgi:hypothetical protein